MKMSFFNAVETSFNNKQTKSIDMNNIPLIHRKRYFFSHCIVKHYKYTTLSYSMTIGIGEFRSSYVPIKIDIVIFNWNVDNIPNKKNHTDIHLITIYISKREANVLLAPITDRCRF